MITFEKIIYLVQIILLIISYLINNLVIWFKQDLNNILFAFFVFFTVTNILVVLTSFTVIFYQPLLETAQQQLKKAINYPKVLILNLIDITINLMALYIIIKNRQVSTKFYKNFSLANTIHFILSLIFRL
jgi:hypothetical protein